MFIFLALTACGRKGHEETGNHYRSFASISPLFPDPPATFRTVPFWVWNEDVTREMIDEQLAGFKARGFGGVFIHPRYGLITDYLSPEWYSLVAYAVRKAGEQGIKLWLYDENSYPSGFAGGHVPAEMPESYNKGVALKLVEMPVLKSDSTKVYQHIFLVSEGKITDITSKAKDLRGKTR